MTILSINCLFGGLLLLLFFTGCQIFLNQSILKAIIRFQVEDPLSAMIVFFFYSSFLHCCFSYLLQPRTNKPDDSHWFCRNWDLMPTLDSVNINKADDINYLIRDFHLIKIIQIYQSWKQTMAWALRTSKNNPSPSPPRSIPHSPLLLPFRKLPPTTELCLFQIKFLYVSPQNWPKQQ